MSDRVPCTRCGNQILPATAERNNGMCKPCVKGKPLQSSGGGGSSKFAMILKLIQVKLNEFLLGAGLAVAGGFLAVFFGWNMYAGFLGDSWLFRFVYSPILILLFLLMFVAGLAFLYALIFPKKSKRS